jgi:hypothetical protein
MFPGDKARGYRKRDVPHLYALRRAMRDSRMTADPYVELIARAIKAGGVLCDEDNPNAVLISPEGAEEVFADGERLEILQQAIINTAREYGHDEHKVLAMVDTGMTHIADGNVPVMEMPSHQEQARILEHGKQMMQHPDEWHKDTESQFWYYTAVQQREQLREEAQTVHRAEMAEAEGDPSSIERRLEEVRYIMKNDYDYYRKSGMDKEYMRLVQAKEAHDVNFGLGDPEPEPDTEVEADHEL